MPTSPDANPSLRGLAAVENLLCSYAPLDEAERTALRETLSRPRTYESDDDIASTSLDGHPTTLLLSGWAGWTKSFPDGRRQVVAVLLPGDVIPVCDDPTLIGAAFTRVEAADAGALVHRLETSLGELPRLAQAWRLVREAAQARLVAQAFRVGRLSAYERMADLLLELLDRQRRAGLVVGAEMPLPLTQRVLADALGLSSVHVNRTLQQMRREGLIQQRGANAIVLREDQLAQVAFRD